MAGLVSMIKKIKKIMACIMSVCMFMSIICTENISTAKGAESTTVYFLATSEWSEVNAYVYGNAGEALGKWPGTAAENIRGNWWKVTVSADAATTPFSIILTNSGETKRTESYISDTVNVYLTTQTDKKYSSKEAAEEAMGVSSGEKETNTGEKETTGSNTDLDYNVDLKGAGANLPYTTYEAEAASTNAEVLVKSRTYRTDIQSEASGRQGVKLKNNGDYVEFTLQKPANTMVIRYCIPDSLDGAGMESTLSMYQDGIKKRDLNLTSKYSWIYGGYPYSNSPSEGKAHRFFDESRIFFNETLNKGAKIRLQKDSGNEAEYYIIDFIEYEMVENAPEKPENSLSITDYGAVANDGNDDYSAIVSCIEAAKSQGKEVWIPAGTFNLTEKRPLEVNGVTIRGAGMWYSNLVGVGAAFTYSGTCKFYDFAMTGNATVRRDSEDLAGFEGKGAASNVTIQNIWMEHMKVGVWSYQTTGLIIQGCRIRNTYADGINMCSSTNNATVRNNNLRNTGDDCIAIWPWQGDSCNNTIEYNTIQCPNLANGIAVYGGSGNSVLNNSIYDTINNGSGICLGTDYDTPNGFSGTTTVKGNVLVRCGSQHTDYSYPVGAIWIWATKKAMSATFNINENTLYDCSYEGVLIDGWNSVSGLYIKDNNIYGATDGIYVRGNSQVVATVENVGVAEGTGELIKNDNTSANINTTGKGIYRTEMPDTPEPDVSNVSIEINGYQISMKAEGIRTIYTIDDPDEEVESIGLIYGKPDLVSKSEMICNGTNSNVFCYQATENGKASFKLGSSTSVTYVMTMQFNTDSTEFFSTDFYVRAYAKLKTGEYVYGDVHDYSVYNVADYLYQKACSTNAAAHDYLYNNILKKVSPEYKTVDYDWGNTIVPVK